MTGYRVFYIQGSGSSWKDKLRLAVAAIIGVAILAAALVLSLGLALVLVPLAILAYLFRRPLLRAFVESLQRRQPPGQPRPEPGPRPETRTGTGKVTIETEYTIIPPEDRRPR